MGYTCAIILRDLNQIVRTVENTQQPCTWWYSISTAHCKVESLSSHDSLLLLFLYSSYFPWALWLSRLFIFFGIMGIKLKYASTAWIFTVTWCWEAGFERHWSSSYCYPRSFWGERSIWHGSHHGNIHRIFHSLQSTTRGQEHLPNHTRSWHLEFFLWNLKSFCGFVTNHAECLTHSRQNTRIGLS